MAKLVATVAAVTAGLAFAQNNRPIIGILSLPNSNPAFPTYRSYFAASYVKWLESGGARVVPIPYTLPDDEIRALLKSINGVLFTGGGTEFTNPDGTLTPFARAGQIIFNETVQSWARGEMFPLWGTCLGHELISVLAANVNESTLTGGFDSENITLPLDFWPAAATSRMYSFMPPSVLNTFATQPVTMNNHVMGITPADFNAAPSLASRFSVLSTNLDRNGKPFVSSMEGKNGLPIFTAQYHPEKIQFEWISTQVINHSLDSVVANQYLALFFVEQARNNDRAFLTPQAESAALIYNYAPAYTGTTNPAFQQCYFFP